MPQNPQKQHASNHDQENAIKRLTGRVARQLAFLCLRSGMSFGDLLEITKTEFCSAAIDHIAASGERPTTSRVAILSGLTRADVARTMKRKEAPPSPAKYRARVDRVLHGWESDPDFTGNDGLPAVLPKRGERSFEQLCRKYSGDMPTKALLDELIFRDAITLTVNSFVALKSNRAHPVAQFDCEDAGETIETAFRAHTKDHEDGHARAQKVGALFSSARVPPHVIRTCRRRVDKFLAALSHFIQAEAIAAHEKNHGDESTLNFIILEDERNSTSHPGISKHSNKPTR